MNSFYALRSTVPARRHGVSASDWVPSFEIEAHSPDIDCIQVKHGAISVVLLGNLFDRQTMQPIVAAEELHLDAGNDIINCLLDGYWGRYVALIVDLEAARVTLLRDPSGQMPLYWTLEEERLRCSSRLSGLGANSFAVDWEGVMEHLIHQGRHTARTCLQGVHELAPGLTATFSAEACDIICRWKPELNDEHRHRSSQVLATRLQSEVKQVVLAWQRRFPTLLLTLSGGLDSSIIAACLRSDAARVRGLNLVSGVGLGNESAFAQAVAARSDLPLEIVEIRPGRVDLRCSAAADRPRPAARGYTQASDEVAAMAAKEQMALAHFNGGGGDNIFGFLHSSYPAADALLDAGPGPAYWRTVHNLARLTASNIWTIGYRSLRHAMLGRSASHDRQDISLLSPAYRHHAIERHPWMKADSSGRPGHRQHLSHILEAVHYSEYLGHGDSIPTIYPLLSQPLMEYCLSIPSWRWCENGRDRSLARMAFSTHLPHTVLDRRVKGSFEQFLLKIFYSNIEEIRSMMAEGQLARRGMIDSDACLDLLSRPDRMLGGALGRILHFADVEAWLSARGIAPAGASIS